MPPRAETVRYSLATLRRASLIRRCHPGPRRRKCSITSGSSRSETSFLVFSASGRPRLINLSPWYRSACSNHSFVNSGASSGSIHLLAPVLFFFGMTVPHRDNVPRIAALRPYDHHHPATEITRRDGTRLPVIETVVGPAEGLARKHQLGMSEIQTALPLSLIALGRVEGDLHGYNVATKIAGSKIFVATKNIDRCSQLMAGAAA